MWGYFDEWTLRYVKIQVDIDNANGYIGPECLEQDGRSGSRINRVPGIHGRGTFMIDSSDGKGASARARRRRHGQQLLILDHNAAV